MKVVSDGRLLQGLVWIRGRFVGDVVWSVLLSCRASAQLAPEIKPLSPHIKPLCVWSFTPQTQCPPPHSLFSDLRSRKSQKSTYLLAHHACPSPCCLCIPCLCPCGHSPCRPHSFQHLRHRGRRSPPQQSPLLALHHQLRQAQVLPVHVSNRPNSLLSTPTHPSFSNTLDQYLKTDVVTRVAVDAVGLASVHSYVATAVRPFCQLSFCRSNPSPAPRLLAPLRLVLRRPRSQLRPVLPEDQSGRQGGQRPHLRTHLWTEPWPFLCYRLAHRHWLDYPRHLAGCQRQHRPPWHERPARQ